MNYNDIDPRKKAFVFELDDVLYPEKDYLYQVYYLFASMLEYTELLDSKILTSLMTRTYDEQGEGEVYKQLQQKFKLADKYQSGFEYLLDTARLPLKLLLYKNMLELLQDIVVDRKRIFIVTNGSPQRQLNKIKQTEWHDLESYLTCYFANELSAKPEPDAIHQLMKEHQLQRRDLLMIGKSQVDEWCAEASGIDFYNVVNFLS